MPVATMLQPASRSSASSSSSFQPITRQNTMSSHDTRSLRQSKRMSVTALYLSMSAKDRDLEISDDLAKGIYSNQVLSCANFLLIMYNSPATFARSENENLLPIQEELRPRERCAISRFADSFVDSEPDGAGRGKPILSISTRGRGY